MACGHLLQLLEPMCKGTCRLLSIECLCERLREYLRESTDLGIQRASDPAIQRSTAYVLVKNTLARVLRGIALRYNPELARITGQLEEYYRQRRPVRDIEPLELQQVRHMGRVLDEVDRLLEEIEAPDD